MTYDRPPRFVSASAVYVLEVLRNTDRQIYFFEGNLDPYEELTFETTIRQWRERCDLLPWRGLGRALNEEWKLTVSASAWRAVLEPAKQRTLRDLCEFLAECAKMPVIEPLTILGKVCYPAGAFLAIRSLLRDAGANVDAVAPSTLLGEYTRRYLDVFLGPIAMLAPNTLPSAHVKSSINRFFFLSVAGFVLGLLLILAGSFTDEVVVYSRAILCLVMGFATVLAGHYQKFRLPEVAEFEGLRTFKDLAIIVANGSNRPGF